MPTQSEFANIFRALHQKGAPVILFNIWDPGSAKAVAAAGVKALATGSAPVAMAHGFADGEHIPFELALDNTKRIVASTALPVSMDLEGGYGTRPDEIAANISRAAETGIAGFNFEDQIIGGDGLYPLAEQSARLTAAREGADAVCAGLFINARTDIFLKAKPDTHSRGMLDAALERAKAFEQAGADGFFAPGLADEALIGALCEASPLPVNIIALPHAPSAARIRELGAARISYGPVPYKRMSAWLEAEARTALG